MNSTNYLSLLLFFMGLIVTIIAFFLKDFHISMKQAISTLTEAVNKLTLVITTIESNHEHLSLRVENLEKDFKEYKPSLEFIRENKNDLKKILP